MKITKFTITQTMQVKQYHPLVLSVDFEVTESEDLDQINKKITQAHRFVHNTLRAECYREDLLNGVVTEEKRVAVEKYIEKHIATNYFEEEKNDAK